LSTNQPPELARSLVMNYLPRGDRHNLDLGEADMEQVGVGVFDLGIEILDGLKNRAAASPADAP
jgi:hypothetical protein